MLTQVGEFITGWVWNPVTGQAESTFSWMGNILAKLGWL